MRIDLASHSVSSLRIHGTIESSYNLIEIATEAMAVDHGQGNLFAAVAAYRKRGVTHRLEIAILPSDDRYDFTLRYECPSIEGMHLPNPPQSVLRTTRQLERLFSSAPFTDVSSDFHCDARFHHTGSDVSTLVTLPMMTTDDASLPFTAVTGVRFVKYTGEQHEYSVSMTKYRRDDSLISTVQFHLRGVVSTAFPSLYLSRSVQISENFISFTGYSDATS